jgi:hypothetical protein
VRRVYENVWRVGLESLVMATVYSLLRSRHFTRVDKCNDVGFAMPHSNTCGRRLQAFATSHNGQSLERWRR